MAVQFTEEAIRNRMTENRAEKAAVDSESAPIRAERDKLRTQIQPLEDKMRDLNRQIQEIEVPNYELEMEYSRLARMLGTNRNVEAVDASKLPQNQSPEPETNTSDTQ
jgi:septal ring factor EnvC (AmiA/AmiB activator)